ncbi:MAG: hypothetical protein JSV10_07985 [Candidatus Zixiibacteriota bacterium]|nr:MAG: hypothetical protein JSV10_07985 [candidate division Zixibacteria bacterium]
MNLRVLFRHVGVLVLIMVLLRFGGDSAPGSEALKGKKPAKSADATVTTQEPCDTALEMMMGSAAPAYYWKQPPRHPFLNMQFEMPADHGGRLDYIELVFYEGGSSGTPDPDAYVWLSDGSFPLDTKPPSQAIAEFHVDYEEIVWFPGGTFVQAYHLGIEFDPGELFHVGVFHALEPGDTLAHLSDDGSTPNERASAWSGKAWESLAPYLYKMYVWICPFPAESTFTMNGTPSIGSATPGDPPTSVFQVHLTSILGYQLPVTLSLLSVSPEENITATFTPNGIPPGYTSEVTVTVNPSVPYGDYALTFAAMGGDGQTRSCDVTLRVQPPYDEAEVDFYHGTQRATNFGAVGNSQSAENFVWYGDNYLFDGTFLLATTDPDHMALDIYDCEQWGWATAEHLNVYYDPQYDANIAFGNLFSETIPGEHDSTFIVGIMQDSVDFSIKIKIFYNPTETAIPQLYAGMFEDWDVSGGLSNWVEMDTLHNLMYTYDPADPSTAVGIMTAPFYDGLMHSMIAFDGFREIRIIPEGSFCYAPYGPTNRDTLFVLMTDPDPHYRFAGWLDPDPTDYCLLTTSPPFTLEPGDGHIEIWIDFGRDLNDGMTWEQWYHKVLRYVGFYRGDVNPPYGGERSVLDVGDVIHLVNYLFKTGPVPFPYPDQGDVNADGAADLGDLVYLINYLYRGGPPPTDYVRFIPSFWSRSSLFTNPNWQ